MNDIKEGKFGFPEPELPKFVKQMVDDVTKRDIDWQQCEVDGDDWLVCKRWINDQSFYITVSKVIFEYDLIRVEE